MIRDEAIKELRELRKIGEIMTNEHYEAIDMAIKALEQEPKEITLDEVKEYCRKRCLTLVTNQLFHELTHHQEPILDKIRTEIEHLTITEGGEDYIRKMAELYSLKIKVLQIIDKYREQGVE